MKKLLILMITLPFVLNFGSSTLAEEDVFSYSQSEIVTKSKFIEPLYTDGTTDNFSVTKSIIVSSKNNVYKWNLNFLRYSDATNADPGDYECIEIRNGSNVVICKLKNDISWMKINNSLRSYTNNEYFIPIQLSETSTALIFTGCQYPSEIQLLTIVLIEKDKAKLIFNKKMEINSINNLNNSFSMILQSNMQVEKTDPLVQHRIWSENGVLKFENL